MARIAVQISVKALAEAATISTNTTVRFERGDEFKPRTVADIRSIFEHAGISFIDGDYADSGDLGVRLNK
ncbi:transcriptional regulator [Ensifer sp.]|uniref:transcriptional regulator n=1 Tax=Ensifer sp. TaxID=1872086 RepID=UPI00289B7196|nr:transcriptional regulator [Ensifer sp.]